jgi:hypothetical protein
MAQKKPDLRSMKDAAYKRPATPATAKDKRVALAPLNSFYKPAKPAQKPASAGSAPKKKMYK